MRTYLYFALALGSVALPACSRDEWARNSFMGARDLSVFQRHAGDYCGIFDESGKKRLEASCKSLSALLDREGEACQAAPGFMPWEASFPDSPKRLRLCRSQANPERPAKARVRFVVFGDAGAGDDARQGYAQGRVAAAMAQVCAPGTPLACDFAVVTGDLIYPDGVKTVFDWQLDGRFEDAYGRFGRFDFYMALGNHDYHGNVVAKTEYSWFSERWRMPARYYGIPDLPPWLHMVTLDTTPLTGEVPGAGAEEQWELARASLCGTEGWKLLVGHHPPLSHGRHGGNGPMLSLLAAWHRECAFDAYLAGHDHHQEHIQTKLFDTFIQGAGGSTVRAVAAKPGVQHGADGVDFEQLFARSEHGFALVDATPYTMEVAFYALSGWDVGGGDPLVMVGTGAPIYRCVSRMGEDRRCKSEP